MDELKKVKKHDILNMKRIPNSIEALFEESRVKLYRSKLEEMIARKKDNSKLTKDSGVKDEDVRRVSGLAIEKKRSSAGLSRQVTAKVVTR